MKFFSDNIVLIAIAFASGAMLLWPVVMRRTAGASLDTLGATRLINDTGALIVDVRSPAEYAAGHLPNAKNIPLSDIDKRASELPGGKPVIICCASGMRSARAAAALRKAGRTDVFNLDGGVQAWQQAGLPVAK